MIFLLAAISAVFALWVVVILRALAVLVFRAVLGRGLEAPLLWPSASAFGVITVVLIVLMTGYWLEIFMR